MKILLFFPLLFLINPTLKAETSGLAGNIGLSYGVGDMGNEKLELKDRSMSISSLDVLTGYRFSHKFLAGLNFQYRYQQQQTSLNETNNTNLAGHGWLLGIGSQYKLSSRFALQLAVNFLGQYGFEEKSNNGDRNHLSNPVSGTLKGQYFFNSKLPLSFDALAGYTTWKNFKIGPDEYNHPTKQWMVGVGITYHFGDVQEPAKEVLLPVPVAQKTSQFKELSNLAEAEKFKMGILLRLDAGGFEANSSHMSLEFREKLKRIAQVLVREGHQIVLIKGHTDDSGDPEINKELSQERADAVKIVFIQNGVSAKRITAIGMGSQEPLFDNATAVGRAQNRRVEIELQEKK